jgi:hypothetical protein
MKRIYLLPIMASLAVCGMAQDRQVVPEQVKVRFFPNPATSVINFEFIKSNPESTYTLQVYNFIGKKVSEIVVTNNRATVSLDNYFRGVYIFQLKDKTGKIIQSGKFQVAK